MISSRIRIIAGQWRGRWLEFPGEGSVRPTGNRIRETLFNWLMHDVQGARCLDAFSGSGALAFEALSRGAAEVVALEKDAAQVRLIMENAKRLHASGFQVFNKDFFNFQDTKPFELVFLDPPFHQNLLFPALENLIEKKLLAPTHKIYVELEKETLLMDQLPSGFEVLKHQTAGKVQYGLLRLAGLRRFNRQI